MAAQCLQKVQAQVERVRAINFPSAIRLLRRYVEGEHHQHLLDFLQAQKNATAAHLHCALREQPQAIPGLLEAVAGLKPPLLQSLTQGGYLPALAAKRPTEKQLAYLQALGYRGPVPGNALEASRLIEKLRGDDCATLKADRAPGRAHSKLNPGMSTPGALLFGAGKMAKYKSERLNALLGQTEQVVEVDEEAALRSGLLVKLDRREQKRLEHDLAALLPRKGS